MPAITSIADLRTLAQRRVPRAIFEYADRGSYDELTLQANRRDLDALKFRQRVLVDLSTLSIGTTVMNEPWTMPVAIAPTGLSGLFHRDGEIHGARAAEAFGVPYCLSTMSICSIEDVRAAVTKPFWFQIYLMRDRAFNEELIARALAAQCSTLVLTLDLQVQGLRRRDVKNGLSIPPRLTLANALDMMTKPRWAAGVLFGKRRTFGNLEARLKESAALKTLSQWIATQFDPSVTWKDLEWVRARWPGRLVLKGILDSEDAARAATSGADALVVSNHGGRQLDSAPSSISVLPSIIDAVSGHCEVLFDGGVQSGQDVLRALALGAKGCMIGKAYLYALAAMGGEGVARALQIIRRELEVTLALTGCTDVRAVDPSILMR